MKITEVIDMVEVATQELYNDINANPHLYEMLQGSKNFTELTKLLASDEINIGQNYSPVMLQALTPAYRLNILGYKQLLKLVDIINHENRQQYILSDGSGKQVKYPEDQNLGDILNKTYLYGSVEKANSIADTFIPLRLKGWDIKDSRK